MLTLQEILNGVECLDENTLVELSDKLWQFKVNQNANIQWIAFHLSNETTLPVTKLRGPISIINEIYG